MTQVDDLRNLGPAEVQVAELQAQLLVHIHRLVDVERRGDGLVQHGTGCGHDLDFTGGHVRVGRLAGAQPDLAFHLQHPFVAHAVGNIVCGRVLWIEDDLDNAPGVAQVEKNQAAVVPAAVHPSGQAHSPARIRGAQITGIRIFEHGERLAAGEANRLTTEVAQSSPEVTGEPPIIPLSSAS